MKRVGGAAPASQILRSVFEELEKRKTLYREDVEAQWGRIAGKAPSKHSRPVILRKNVLTVQVDSPAWMHELSLRKRTLLKQLKSVFGKDRIAEIQFKIGEI